MAAPLRLDVCGLVYFVTLFASASGCTNVLITKGASKSGHSMIGYNADSAPLHGAMSHWPYGEHDPGHDKREIYSWDLGKYLGSIPQAPKTYNVMGNANCQGLTIGETTLGGLSELSNVGKDHRNGTILDYGQLIWITLQRAATAREAIDVIASLTSEYGYASDMEGFSISDSTTGEVWYMELIGKGSYGKGIVFVALRVPDGYVHAHANQARITTFLPCDDPSTCRMAKDTVTFAIDRGYWHGSATDPAFSFSDTYDPVTFSGARFCEARVWYVFSQIAHKDDFDAAFYLPYAQGSNLTRRMPLFVKPKAKLTLDDAHALLSHHFQGSFFDPATDVGAGAEHSPYRWNGLAWQSAGGQTYVNERVVGVHYTAWHFVTELREHLPKPMGALMHWGADDHSWAPKIPVHGGAAAVHASYDDHDCTSRDACRRAHGLPGTVTNFSWESAWWVNQVVADQVYTRKDRAAPVVLAARAALHDKLAQALTKAEAHAVKLFSAGNASAATGILSDHAVAAGALATATWKALWQELIVTFVDGKTLTADPKNEVCGCEKASATFTDEWKAKVIADAGDHYRKPNDDAVAVGKPLHGKPTRDKLTIRGVAP